MRIFRLSGEARVVKQNARPSVSENRELGLAKFTPGCQNGVQQRRSQMGRP